MNEKINNNNENDDLEINLNINIEKILSENKEQNNNNINTNNNQTEITSSNIIDNAIIDITQTENQNINTNKVDEKEKEDINKKINEINIQKDIEDESNINQSQNNENKEMNNIDNNNNKNEDKDDKVQIINDLKKQNINLEKEISDLKKELKIHYDELTDANNEINNYKNQLKLKTIEEMTKNGKININNNINNININTNINNYKNDKEKKDNTKSENKNNNNIGENTLQNITPENYAIIKSFQYNREFTWYLLRKKNKKTTENFSPIKIPVKKYKKRDFHDDRNESMDDSISNNYSYMDFLWLPAINKKELDEFGELPINESFEKDKIIKTLESSIKILENKCKKREREYNLLNINYSKLVYRNKNEKIDKLLETIDRLKSENRNLSKRLMTYSSKNNFIGLSFIEEDENNNSLIGDKCLEEILDELDNNDFDENNYFYNDNYNYDKYNNKNNNYYQYKNVDYNNGQIRSVKSFKEKMYFKTANKFYPEDMRKGSFKRNVNINEIRNKDALSIPHLKSSIDSLMTQIEPSQSARATFANILRQLGCSDEDIYKLIGNYRGVISIPISKLKYKK